MIVGVCSIEILIPESRSLKDKRKVVRSVIDRARHRHNVSAAEVEHQDLWQRAGIAFAAVSSSRKQLDSTFEAIVREIDRSLPGQITRREVEIL